MQLVAYWKVRVYKLEETACDVCLDIFAKWRVKPNNVALSVPAWLLCYMWHVFQHSNHPPSILRQLPASINKRISTLSSDKQVFDDAVQTYQNALGHSNFSHKLEYMPHITQQPRRNRQRNIIGFNPPFSKNVKTNIARSFLKLVDTHFPKGNKLHKIFNRNTVKVSYSCMSNVKSIITSHNTRIIRNSQPQDISAEICIL